MTKYTKINLIDAEAMDLALSCDRKRVEWRARAEGVILATIIWASGAVIYLYLLSMGVVI
jgi:hypothetical protein